MLRATKAGQHACPRQVNHGSLIAIVNLLGGDALRLPAGERPVLFQAFDNDRRCHSDAAWPSFKPVFVLSREIG